MKTLKELAAAAIADRTPDIEALQVPEDIKILVRNAAAKKMVAGQRELDVAKRYHDHIVPILTKRRESWTTRVATLREFKTNLERDVATMSPTDKQARAREIGPLGEKIQTSTRKYDEFDRAVKDLNTSLKGTTDLARIINGAEIASHVMYLREQIRLATELHRMCMGLLR